MKKLKKKNTQQSPTLAHTAVSDLHRQVIDHYFINGFNKTQALLSVKPNMEYHAAGVQAAAIIDSPQNAAYLQEKRSALRASTDIRNENLLRELMNWAYCDISQFMTLNEEEIKELPPDVTRCIQSFKSIERKTYNPQTKETTTVKTLEIKIVDKKSALDSIAKHIGFYLLDNEQKRTKINLEKVDINILNGFLQAIEYQDSNTINQ